jgi:hypothetical protein
VLELIERDPGELKALYAPVLESIHFSWPILSCEKFFGFRRRWPSVLVMSSSLDLGSIGFPLGSNGPNLVAVFRSLDGWKYHSNWSVGWWLVGDPLVGVFGGTG